MIAPTSGAPAEPTARGAGEPAAPRPPVVPLARRAAAIARCRCPVCCEGRVFRGAIRMNERCGVCGVRFVQEPGYFTGAMYFSYALAIPFIALLALAAHLAFPAWELDVLVLAASVAFLPFVPLVFRWSRVLFMHFDRWCDPASWLPENGARHNFRR